MPEQHGVSERLLQAARFPCHADKAAVMTAIAACCGSLGDFVDAMPLEAECDCPGFLSPEIQEVCR